MRARTWVLAVVLAAWLAPASALGDPGYLTTTANHGILPFNTGTGVFEPPIAAGIDPVDAVIAPDGRTAYLVGSSPTVPGTTTLTPVDLDSGIGLAPIPVAGAGPTAITPDGHTAYIVQTGTDDIQPVDLVGGSAGSPIPLTSPPQDIAIAPDGRTAYATTPSGVIPIDLATNAPGPAIAVSPAPQGIAITPDGSRAYVAGSDATASAVTPIDLATGTAGMPIATPDRSRAIAISAQGVWAYTLSSLGEITPINLLTGTAEAPLALPVGFRYFDRITITPDGRTAYVVNHCEDQRCVTSSLYRVDLQQMTAAGPISVTLGSVYGVVAIAPSPQARFGFAPSPAVVPAAVRFDASESVDAGGTVTSYAWDFGDGTGTTTSAPKTSHVYSRPGSYAVTLTTTNAGGCAVAAAFTGKMAACSGASTATTVQPLTVDPLPPSPVTIAGGPLRNGPGGLVLQLACARTWAQPSCRGVLTVFRARARLARTQFSVRRGTVGKVRLALRGRGRVLLQLTVVGARPASRTVRLLG